MKFGAHVSTAKPFSEAITRAQEIGCECIQIFANPPQRWNPVAIDPVEIERFNTLNKEAKIGPIVIHSIYLVNFASSNPFFYEQSIKSLIDDMKKAEKIGAIGANTHMGSTKGGDFKELLPRIVSAVRQILAETPESTNFIIENAAGSGNVIGDTVEEIASIIQSVNSPRVQVLIDTAHAFESGYDLRTEEELEKFVSNFDKEIGLNKLVGFHLNDSKTSLSSRHDRHADIGRGEIGLESFRLIVSHPKLSDKFGILETPEDQISWKEQLEILRNLS